MATEIWIAVNSKGKGTISELMITVVILANKAVRESIKVRMRMVTMAYGIIYTLNSSNRTVIHVSATKSVISNTMKLTCFLLRYS